MQRRTLLILLTVVILLMASPSFAQRYIGSISLVPYNFAPVNTAFCNGQLMSIAEDAALFDLIGTIYGGDGINTFALPDLRGRVAIGAGTSSAGGNFVLGQVGGEETVTLQVSQLPQHTHSALAVTSTGNTVSPLNDYWAGGPRLLLYSSASSLAPAADVAVGPAGGSNPHDNMKPYLALNYVIWLYGIFPTQN